MKKYIISSLRLTGVLMLLLCVLYPLTIALAGNFSEGKGGGEQVVSNEKVVGYARLGQSFSSPEYFWGRPSAVDYNAAGSAGSNKGPSNPEYLETVAARIDTLLKYHPTIKKSDIPADMVTASGSGLDPHISLQGAAIQIARISSVRGIPEKEIQELIHDQTHQPFLGLFGPEYVNVLALNLALDNIK